MGLLSDHPPIPCADSAGLAQPVVVCRPHPGGGAHLAWQRPRFGPRSRQRPAPLCAQVHLSHSFQRRSQQSAFARSAIVRLRRSWTKLAEGWKRPLNKGASVSSRTRWAVLVKHRTRTVDINGKADPPTVQGVRRRFAWRSIATSAGKPAQAAASQWPGPASNGRSAKKTSTSTASSSDLALPRRPDRSRYGGSRTHRPALLESGCFRQRGSAVAHARSGQKRRRSDHCLLQPTATMAAAIHAPLGGNYNDPEAGRSMPSGSSRAEPRYVNSKRISLNSEIKEEGPSGTSAVELWATRDSRSLGQTHRRCIPSTALDR